MVNRTVGIVSSRIKTIIRLPIRDALQQSWPGFEQPRWNCPGGIVA